MRGAGVSHCLASNRSQSKERLLTQEHFIPIAGRLSVRSQAAVVRECESNRPRWRGDARHRALHLERTPASRTLQHHHYSYASISTARRRAMEIVSSPHASSKQAHAYVRAQNILPIRSCDGDMRGQSARRRQRRSEPRGPARAARSRRHLLRFIGHSTGRTRRHSPSCRRGKIVKQRGSTIRRGRSGRCARRISADYRYSPSRFSARAHSDGSTAQASLPTAL